MEIPDYQTLMRPILELHADGAEHVAADVIVAMADRHRLTAQDRAKMLKTGRQTVIQNRVHWSMTYLSQAGLLQRPVRGRTRITDRGNEILRKCTDRVDNTVLEQFAEFRDFKSRRRQKPETLHDADLSTSSDTAEAPPLELIPELVAEAHAALADELVDQLRAAPPDLLERCVLRLLVKMGYGGPEGEVRHVGGPGDEGVDGLVRQDPLGLDVVYVQAKRYAADRAVQRPDVQAFAGALQGRRLHEGSLSPPRVSLRAPGARSAWFAENVAEDQLKAGGWFFIGKYFFA